MFSDRCSMLNLQKSVTNQQPEPALHPILFQIGPISIYSYGASIAAAFLAGITFASWSGKKEGLDPQKIVDLCFYILIAAIVGSRLLYIVVNYQHYLKNPLDVLKIWQGGLVFYGGLICAVAVAIRYLKKNQLPLWPMADVLAPALALGQCIGRWGCFFAGCCYGKPTELPWGIVFANESSLAPLHQALHPTQIYSSLNGLIIFFLLLAIRKIRKFHGQVFCSYLLLYSVGRFIIEFFRGDERGFAVEEVLSTSQFIGIFLFVTGILLFFRLKKSAVSKPTS